MHTLQMCRSGESADGVPSIRSARAVEVDTDDLLWSSGKNLAKMFRNRYREFIVRMIVHAVNL